MRLVGVAGRDWGKKRSELRTALSFRSNCPNRHIHPATIFIPPLGLEAGRQSNDVQDTQAKTLSSGNGAGSLQVPRSKSGERFACRKGCSSIESTTAISLG